MLLRTALIVVAALAATPSLRAQEADDGLTGTRVRVTAPAFADHRVVGEVVRYTDSRLEVREEGTDSVFVFPLRSIARLDPFKGGSRTSTAWYRGRFGAFVGGALGLLAGAFVASHDDGDRAPGVTVALYGAGGTLAGGALGALSGAALPTERWGWTVSPWGYDPTLRPEEER